MEVEKADDDDLPEFFKVYVARHSSQKLSIPDEFLDYMGGKKSGPAELAGSSGQTWRVELVYNGKNMYFSNGWQAFVSDNRVRDGDFLFFKFYGNLKFSVVIYDESMCEKAVTFVDKCNQHLVDVPEVGHENAVVKPVMRRRARRSHAEGSLFTSDDKIGGRTCISANPSFEKCISVSSLEGHYLRFPNSFVREHSLIFKSYEKMVLRTCSDSTWEVCVINIGGGIILRGGWPAFARENSLRVGDVCKFELLDRLEMLVHVTHRNEVIKREKANVAGTNRSLKKAVGVSHRRLRSGN